MTRPQDQDACPAPWAEKRGIAGAVPYVAVGLLLLGAAALKWHQLATQPDLGHDLLPPWAWAAVASLEGIVGLWLVLAGRGRRAWWVVVGLFGLFAPVAFWQAVRQADTCGCFGVVRINPWWTFALDVGVLAAFLLLRKGLWRDRRRSIAPLRHWTALGAGAALAIVALLALPEPPQAARMTSQAIGDEPFVVLEPETWLDQQLPLLPFLQVDEDLSAGTWELVLYRHDCSHCVAELPRYGKMANDLQSTASEGNIVLVEVPPYGNLPFDENILSSCVRGRLKDVREWFVQTPTRISIRSGHVTAVITPSGDAL